MIIENGSSDRGPRLGDSQDSLLTIALNESSGGGVEEDRLDSKEGEGRGSRFRSRSSRERTL